MAKNRDEISARREAYIRILEMFAVANDDVLCKYEEFAERKVMDELKDAHLIEFDVGRVPNQPDAKWEILDPRLTFEGFQQLEKLKTDQWNDSLRGKFLNGGWQVFLILFGGLLTLMQGCVFR